MPLAPGDQFSGVPAEVAREAARIVDSVQWCSAGVLARELRIDTAASRLLLEALESDGCLTRHDGVLPPGYGRAAWLSEEEAREPLVLWHLRSPGGRALAKARIGSAVPRPVAESLLAQVLDRVLAVNDNFAESHIIARVTLFGSLTDPGRKEVGDVDLLVYAHRRTRSTESQGAGGKHSAPEAKQRMQLPEDEAANQRMSLEALPRAGDERLDVCVFDESSDNPRPLPDGAIEREVFRREPPPSGMTG